MNIYLHFTRIFITIIDLFLLYKDVFVFESSL